MKKYLLVMVIALTTLFAASSERVPFDPDDVAVVHRLTGYSLEVVKEDADPYPEQNRSKYVSEDGNVCIQAFRGCPFKLKEEFAGLFDVRVRFKVITTGKFDMADSVDGLDVLERSTGNLYNLIVYSGPGAPRAALVNPSTHSSIIAALCVSMFGVVPVFTDALSTASTS